MEVFIAVTQSLALRRLEEEKRMGRGHAKGWIGVDFDGTLATYDGFKGDDVLGEPIAPMVERVKAWLTEGRRVKLFTARIHEFDKSEAQMTKVRNALETWCVLYIGQVLEITCVKDHGLYELWDDRAVGVERNTGRRIGEDDGEPLPREVPSSRAKR